MIERKTDDEGNKVILIGGDEIDLLDYYDGHAVVELDIDALTDETTAGFPHDLLIQIHSERGFGTYLFHELHISKVKAGVALDFICHQPNKYWDGRWGLATFLDAVQKQVEHHSRFSIQDVDLEDDWKRLLVRQTLANTVNFGEAIGDAVFEIRKVIKEAEVSLAGMSWKREYETDESTFCMEVLLPLLRRLGFLSVRYTHGKKEYGKDFTFSEMTPFNHLRHYGLQAKAGNISGGVNSDVDKLLGQIKDAFSMSYCELGSKESRYISVYIIAISGKFTENAREKIVEKMPKGAIGSVYFLDRENLIELIERYWVSKSPE